MTNTGDYEYQIATIIKSLFPRTGDILSTSVYNKPLTGYPLYLEGFEMVYVFFEIEKKLAIRFNENDLYGYNLLSIERIAKRVYDKYNNAS